MVDSFPIVSQHQVRYQWRRKAQCCVISSIQPLYGLPLQRRSFPLKETGLLALLPLLGHNVYVSSSATTVSHLQEEIRICATFPSALFMCRLTLAWKTTPSDPLTICVHSLTISQELKRQGGKNHSVKRIPPKKKQKQKEEEEEKKKRTKSKVDLTSLTLDNG